MMSGHHDHHMQQIDITWKKRQYTLAVFKNIGTIVSVPNRAPDTSCI